ncbi:hypothetical protein B296_00024508 [Ensete ventricosum]|uniref:PTC1-like winged helix-turn-helix domain-containing protein n=1 Tax=Ensete ventricosum TaxID=4639 RepID=A0A427ACK4_ENSVE|nr:hypothetical protein B296_00024508 [Ensete ventricosum]
MPLRDMHPHPRNGTTTLDTIRPSYSIRTVGLIHVVHTFLVGALELDAFYEIDHEKLPPKSPIHLKAIQVVKVCEATKLEVIVSFLSTLALRNYFALSPELGREPELDERFVMSSNQAAQILRLPVPPSKLEEQKHLLKAATGEGDEGPVVLGEVRGDRDKATGDHEGEGAELEKPIMRQALREEARKHIGDTGLLDHLLKHMASGFGGGTTRRARWSTGWMQPWRGRSARRLGWRDPIEGAMEYWLHAPVMVR